MRKVIVPSRVPEIAFHAMTTGGHKILPYDGFELSSAAHPLQHWERVNP